MADEPFNNQRPVVITAVIVAALTAAGLWYFLVFRPTTVENATEPIPTIIVDAPSESAVATFVPSARPTPTPPPAGGPTPAPLASTTPIKPTAPTGPADVTVGAAVVAMIAGLAGVLITLRARSRAI